MRLARKEPLEPVPICRCRVLYLGSSVPQVTKDGLQGIQEPLRELYPAEGAVSAKGIDSWLSVWSNGLLLENVDENQKKVTRFFPIETLHYCAAVRYVVVPGGNGPPMPRFLPLDSPFARNPNASHPPLFACILRRTSGIKVLECHSFICKKETAANALVRFCFHAYADSLRAKNLESGGTSQEESTYARATEEVAIEVDYTGDLSSANSEIIPASARSSPTEEAPTRARGDDDLSIFNEDDNHKVWAGPPKTETEVIYSDYGGTSSTLRSARSTSSIYGTGVPSKNSRPRQMIMPSVAPPPQFDDKTKNEKKDKRNGKSKNDNDEMNGFSNGRPPSVINGKRVPFNGGSLPRPTNGGPPAYPMNGSLMRSGNGYGVSPKPKGKIPRMFSSLSERKNKGKRPPPPFMMIPPSGSVPMGAPLNGPPPHAAMMHQQPHMMAPPAHHMIHPNQGPHSQQHMQGPHPQQHMQGPHPQQHMQGPHPQQHMQGPHPQQHIQGPHPQQHMQGPHPQQHMQGPPLIMGPYGPLPPPPYVRRPHSRAAEEPIYMPSSRPMSPTASYQPAHFPHEQYLMQQYASTGRTKHKKKKKRKEGSPDDDDLYVRKGHLNERAFSHSIREEHRSQSFVSLAGLDDGASSHMSKKDREMMQMVADLDLSGDEIERSEVRPGAYKQTPPHAMSTPRVAAGVGSVNSRSSRH